MGGQKINNKIASSIIKYDTDTDTCQVDYAMPRGHAMTSCLQQNRLVNDDTVRVLTRNCSEDLQKMVRTWEICTLEYKWKAKTTEFTYISRLSAKID